MPRPLPFLVALLLGVGCALLVACGGGGTKGGLPGASAGDLKAQIEDVQQAVDDGRCEDVSGQLRQVDTSIDDLPASVDERLRQSLRDASDKLRRTAVGECKDSETTTTATQTQAQTQPQTQTTATQTQTEPPATTTAPPPTTTPPPTTVPPPPPQTTPTTPVPPAEPPAPPPGGTPGGGATPEVGPE